MAYKTSLKKDKTFRLGKDFVRAVGRRADIVSLGADGKPANIPFPNDLCIDKKDIQGEMPASRLWEMLQRRVYDRDSITHEEVIQNFKRTQRLLEQTLSLSPEDVETFSEIIRLAADENSTPQRATKLTRELAVSLGEIAASYRPRDPYEDEPSL